MTTKLLINWMSYFEIAFYAAALFALVRSKDGGKFRSFTALLSVRLISGVAELVLIGLSSRGVSHRLAYDTYFYVYWVSYAIEAVLSLLVVYSLFRLAMAPLKGLADLGILVFRWAAAISIAVACGIAIIPHQATLKFLISMVTQLQQTSSILTLCLLLFVCFAIRPLGLTFQSRIFGISLGLGITASVSLVDSAWIAHNPTLFTALNLVDGIATCMTLLVWTAYFTMPEPKRRMIVVPTTSPYLKWNQISEVLGDEPGFVALGEFHPELFAPAEWEIMGRASAKISAASTYSGAPGPSATIIAQSNFNPGMLSRSA